MPETLRSQSTAPCAVSLALTAHLRRRFYELPINGSSQIATQTITTMAGLWKIEEEIRGCDAAVRLTARRDRSAAIVADLFKLWETELPRISGKSKLAEAIRYATSRREILGRFLLDGRIEIDSNIVERAIRPQTITRKNALFAGSDGGGRTWATIATLLQTAKMNDVDPLAWLTQTLERIAKRWPISQIDEIMPWNYKASTDKRRCGERARLGGATCRSQRRSAGVRRAVDAVRRRSWRRARGGR